MKKQIIWDLFGGGCNSIANALDLEKYELYTFDVVPTKLNNFKHKNYYYYELDLAVGMNFKNKTHTVNGFDNIIDLFKSLNLPQPDIITSSTLCQSFSNVLSLVGGGTCFWKKEIKDAKLDSNVKLLEREVEEFERLKGNGFTKNLSAEKQLFTKRLGEQCVINTVELIKHFKPKYWYIENPLSSLIWFYIKNNLNFHGFFNKVSLGAYGYPTDKSAAFWSNIELNLNTEKFEPKFIKQIFENEEVFLLENSTLEMLKQNCETSTNQDNFVY
ncbi:MAG: hypothetical protein ACRC4M_05795, partial [Mycoplasma sp.]